MRHKEPQLGIRRNQLILLNNIKLLLRESLVLNLLPIAQLRMVVQRKEERLIMVREYENIAEREILTCACSMYLL
jgi:hypothetical protein